MRSIFILLLCGAAGQAQRFSFGAKAGSPLTAPLPQNFALAALSQGPWTGGPSVEIRIWKQLSLEVDVLFRNYQLNGSAFPFTLANAQSPLFQTTTRRTLAIDVPFLLKYRMPEVRKARPFVSVGLAAGLERSRVDFRVFCPGVSNSCVPPGSDFRTGPGTIRFNQDRGAIAVAAAGVEFRTHRTAIAPEVRYSRLHLPNTNMVTALVGFRFR